MERSRAARRVVGIAPCVVFGVLAFGSCDRGTETADALAPEAQGETDGTTQSAKNAAPDGHLPAEAAAEEYAAPPPAAASLIPIGYDWPLGQKLVYSIDVEAGVGDDAEKIHVLRTYDSVDVSTVPTRPTYGRGTAFVVTSDGYLLTCEHVVHNTTSILAHLGEKAYETRVIAVDRAHDLALLRIGATDLPPLPLGEATAVRVGQETLSAAYRFGDDATVQPEVSGGLVSGILRGPWGMLFQIDVMAQTGDSGGPLVDQNGAVIGVTRATRQGPSDSPAALAEPISRAIALLEANHVHFVRETGANVPESDDLAEQIVASTAWLTVTESPPRMLSYTDAFAPIAGAADANSAAASLVKHHLMITGHGDFATPDLGDDRLAFTGSMLNVAVDQLCEQQRTVTVERHVILPGSSSGAVHWPDRIPAIERIRYQLGEPRDGKLSVKKHFEIVAATNSEPPPVRVVGDVTVEFDLDKRLPGSMEGTATVTLNFGDKPKTIPIKMAYARVDAPQPATERPAADAREVSPALDHDP